MKKTLLGLSCLILLGSACSKKDNTANPAELTPKEVLMGSTWKRSAYKENGVAMNFWSTCEMDDKLSFGADGNYHFTDDGVKCTSNNYTMTDFYIVLSDNTTMRWGGFGEGQLSFNSSKTAFTFKGSGASVQQEWTYVKY